MNSHLEVVTSVQVMKTRFMITVDYLNDLDAAYRVVQYNDVNPKLHDNEVLAKRRPARNEMTFDDDVALEQFYNWQLNMVKTVSARTGGILMAFNS